MAKSGQKRGNVGLAAEALKEALIAKLQRGAKDSPLNHGIFQAIKLVEGFLQARKESPEELEALKSEIKRLLMTQIVAKASLPPHPTQDGRSRPNATTKPTATAASLQQQHQLAQSLPQPLPQPQQLQPLQQRPQAQPLPQPPQPRPQTQSQLLLQPLPPRPLTQAQVRAQLQQRSQALPSQPLPGASALQPQNDAARGEATGGNKPRRASARSSGSVSLDWTLPQRTLNRKAYVRVGDFGRMTLVQDELARRAEAARAAEAVERRRAVLEVSREQMELLRKRKEDEREARRQAQRDMDEQLRQYQASEAARMQRQREQQSQLRGLYAGQVEEQQARKRSEAEQRMREHEAERLQLLEEERRERERQEKVARENAEQREALRVALLAAMEEKAAARLALIEEENRYNRECIAKMDADEAARRQVVALRQERMRLAVERGGGAALQASLEQQERAAAERAERLAAQQEAANLERERQTVARRQRQAEEALRQLDAQIAEKEAQKRAAAEAEERLRATVRAAEAAARAEAEAAKAARRRAQAEALEEQKAAVAEQHRRRYQEYREPVEDRYRWLHAGALSGTQRAFNNLAVPAGKAAVLAGMTV
ncbi:hypothetical protein Agub_g5483 [Astrephomene gubernaculifera]|uniref:Uncharacterized protein n=1 Tax=Astrephomene gubernaculifera TaxID=47775 RepID=A0AAD3DPK5_9CHLO|nr:hypothetical protein Agub_g5483 [Astrephomene gubernaculifera]